MIRDSISIPEPDSAVNLNTCCTRLLGVDLEIDGKDDNLIDREQVLPVNWSLSRATYSTGHPDPWGGSSAVQVLEDTQTGVHGWSLFMAYTYDNWGRDGAYVIEYWLKPIGPRIRFRMQGLYYSSAYDIILDGTINGAGTGLSVQGGTPGSSQFSAHEDTALTLMSNGWCRCRMAIALGPNVNKQMAMQFANNAAIADAINISYAGIVTAGYYIAGLKLIRPRQKRQVANFKQETLALQPSVSRFLDRYGTTALAFERCNGGQYLENTQAADLTWADGRAFTLFHVGRLASNAAYTAGDTVVVQAQDSGGTSYYQYGYRASSGEKMFIRQVKSGGNDISSLSTTAAAHVPSVRAVVLNGTTAQHYADGLPDGSAAPFVLQSMTPARERVGNISGHRSHQLSDYLVVPRALNDAEVLAYSTQLAALHGMRLGPWKLLLFMGQSNGYLRGNASMLPKLVRGYVRVGVPFSNATGVPAAGITAGMIPTMRHPSSTEALYPLNMVEGFGASYMVARELQDLKIAICQYAVSGVGWDWWDPSIGGLAYAPWIARAQAVKALIALPCEYACVVSLLGEGNCGPGIESVAMAAQIGRVIDGARADLSAPNMRHVISLLSDNQTALDPYRAIVNAGMVLRESQDPLTNTVNQDGIHFASDYTHYTDRGLVEAGYRLSRAVRTALA
jgi:hypothetical protein